MIFSFVYFQNFNNKIFGYPYPSPSKVNVKTIDLSQNLVPDSVYSTIQCRISAKFQTETTLCLNDINIDGMAKEIWVNDRFEPHILGEFAY